ncbi:GNAT family N-acetyltransferase [Roseibium sp. M-1]
MSDPRAPAPSVRLTALGAVPEVLEEIERWYCAEWPGWYGLAGPGDARRDLDRCLNPPGRLPRCLMALNADNQPVGTVSLRDTSPGSDRYPGAWLTALLVPQDQRRTGIGTLLIEAAELEAIRLGFPEILTATASAQSLVLKRGWQQINLLQSASGPLGVYRKVLGAD